MATTTSTENKALGHKHPNVLLVDDEPGIQFGFSRYLSKTGFVVREATTLTEAMEALSNGSFDAIILDINLPDGSGLDWIASLRRNHPDMTILVITGSGEGGLAIESILRGADEFLRKPVSMEDLTVSLQRSLHQEI
ncbi:MAG: response regulator [Acidobacteriia bacterium]|nr:response regulator [Terriglobia bacterium]